MPVLRVVPIYASGHADLMPQLSARLEKLLRLEVTLEAPGFDPESAFDPARGQYNSTLLLAHLLRQQPDHGRILGIAGVDLFIPVLTYVFGEAQLDGRAAVVSVHRLAPEGYGLPPNPELFLTRTVKEAAHELGHTYGLVHCDRSGCVMSRSTYVEEIDLKVEGFCAGCLATVRAAPPR